MSSLLQSLSLSHGSSTRNWSENFMRSLIIQVGGHKEVNDAVIESISQGWTKKVCDWVTFESLGSSVLFEVPLVGDCNLKGITLCSFYSSSSSLLANTNMTPECKLFSILIINHTKAIIQSYKQDSATSIRDNEAEWGGMVANLEAGDQMEVAIVLGQRFTVRRTIIYLVYGEPIHEEIMECSYARDKGHL
ncbi:TMV resistance protein N-like [Senna tora]|uniref:TMV resistance protein N-like n=1 Tax=Senna tora TaxID=362788 RepID=A0A834X9N4_9FABA|nr:TMV resistance protein N-like [Senna tora]